MIAPAVIISGAFLCAWWRHLAPKILSRRDAFKWGRYWCWGVFAVLTVFLVRESLTVFPIFGTAGCGGEVESPTLWWVMVAVHLFVWLMWLDTALGIHQFDMLREYDFDLAGARDGWFGTSQRKHTNVAAQFATAAAGQFQRGMRLFDQGVGRRGLASKGVWGVDVGVVLDASRCKLGGRMDETDEKGRTKLADGLFVEVGPDPVFRRVAPSCVIAHFTEDMAEEFSKCGFRSDTPCIWVLTRVKVYPKGYADENSEKDKIQLWTSCSRQQQRGVEVPPLQQLMQAAKGHAGELAKDKCQVKLCFKCVYRIKNIRVLHDEHFEHVYGRAFFVERQIPLDPEKLDDEFRMQACLDDDGIGDDQAVTTFRSHVCVRWDAFSEYQSPELRQWRRVPNHEMEILGGRTPMTGDRVSLISSSSKATVGGVELLGSKCVEVLEVDADGDFLLGRIFDILQMPDSSGDLQASRLGSHHLLSDSRPVAAGRQPSDTKCPTLRDKGFVYSEFFQFLDGVSCRSASDADKEVEDAGGVDSERTKLINRVLDMVLLPLFFGVNLAHAFTILAGCSGDYEDKAWEVELTLAVNDLWETWALYACMRVFSLSKDIQAIRRRDRLARRRNWYRAKIEPEGLEKRPAAAVSVTIGGLSDPEGAQAAADEDVKDGYWDSLSATCGACAMYVAVKPPKCPPGGAEDCTVDSILVYGGATEQSVPAWVSRLRVESLSDGGWAPVPIAAKDGIAEEEVNGSGEPTRLKGEIRFSPPDRLRHSRKVPVKYEFERPISTSQLRITPLEYHNHVHIKVVPLLHIPTKAKADRAGDYGTMEEDAPALAATSPRGWARLKGFRSRMHKQRTRMLEQLLREKEDSASRELTTLSKSDKKIGELSEQAVLLFLSVTVIQGCMELAVDGMMPILFPAFCPRITGECVGGLDGSETADRICRSQTGACNPRQCEAFYANTISAYLYLLIQVLNMIAIGAVFGYEHMFQKDLEALTPFWKFWGVKIVVSAGFGLSLTLSFCGFTGETYYRIYVAVLACVELPLLVIIHNFKAYPTGFQENRGLLDLSEVIVEYNSPEFQAEADYIAKDTSDTEVIATRLGVALDGVRVTHVHSDQKKGHTAPLIEGVHRNMTLRSIDRRSVHIHAPLFFDIEGPDGLRGRYEITTVVHDRAPVWVRFGQDGSSPRKGGKPTWALRRLSEGKWAITRIPEDRAAGQGPEFMDLRAASAQRREMTVNQQCGTETWRARGPSVWNPENRATCRWEGPDAGRGLLPSSPHCIWTDGATEVAVKVTVPPHCRTCGWLRTDAGTVPATSAVRTLCGLFRYRVQCPKCRGTAHEGDWEGFPTFGEYQTFLRIYELSLNEPEWLLPTAGLCGCCGKGPDAAEAAPSPEDEEPEGYPTAAESGLAPSLAAGPSNVYRLSNRAIREEVALRLRKTQDCFRGVAMFDPAVNREKQKGKVEQLQRPQRMCERFLLLLCALLATMLVVRDTIEYFPTDYQEQRPWLDLWDCPSLQSLMETSRNGTEGLVMDARSHARAHVSSFLAGTDNVTSQAMKMLVSTQQLCGRAVLFCAEGYMPDDTLQKPITVTCAKGDPCGECPWWLSASDGCNPDTMQAAGVTWTSEATTLQHPGSSESDSETAPDSHPVLLVGRVAKASKADHMGVSSGMELIAVDGHSVYYSSVEEKKRLYAHATSATFQDRRVGALCAADSTLIFAGQCVPCPCIHEHCYTASSDPGCQLFYKRHPEISTPPPANEGADAALESCELPEPPEHAYPSHAVNNFNLNNTVKWTCVFGYSGSPTDYCRPGGIVNRTGQCVQVQGCGPRPKLKHAQPRDVGDSWLTHRDVTYSSKLGEHAAGASHELFESDAEFERRILEPRELDEAEPSPAPQKLNSSLQEVVPYQCDPGYQGRPLAQCGGDGQWNVFDDCAPVVTVSGCRCKPKWQYCSNWFATDCYEAIGCPTGKEQLKLGMSSADGAWCEVSADSGCGHMYNTYRRYDYCSPTGRVSVELKSVDSMSWREWLTQHQVFMLRCIIAVTTLMLVATWLPYWRRNCCRDDSG